MADIKIKLSSEDKSVLLDKRNIDKISSLSQLSPNPSDVFYSSLANSGVIELTDTNGNILRKLEEFGPNDIKIDICSGEDDSQHCSIQKHILKWNKYDIQDKKVRLFLSNEIDFLNSTIDDVYIVDENGKRNLSSTSLYYLVVRLFKLLNFSDADIEYMMSKNLIRGENEYYTVSEYFKSIIISFPYLKSGKVKNMIDKICAVGQVSFVADNDGRFLFLDARPVLDQLKPTIFISPSRMFSPLEYDPFSKKQIKSIGYSENSSRNEFSSIEKLNISLFQQTEEQRTVQLKEGLTVFEGFEHQQAYSGNLSDYAEIGPDSQYSNSVSENISIVGYYPAVYNNTPQNNASCCVYKIRVDISQYITEIKDFKIALDSVDFNELITTHNPKKDVSEFLKNRLIRNFSPNFSVVFSKNEKEALACFGITDSEGNLIAVNYGGPYFSRTVSIVVSGSELFVYHAINRYDKVGAFTTDTNIPENYTGELMHIYLNFNMSLLLKKINTISTLIGQESDYELANNELMQLETKFMEKDIFSVQTENILKDYKSGILSASTTVGCFDYYDMDGNLIKQWKNGETLSIGDIVCFDNDYNPSGERRRWKITGRSFEYDSEPVLNLDLVEVLPVSGLFDNNGNLIYSWDKLVLNDYISVDNSVVTGSNSSVLNGVLIFPPEITEIGARAFQNCTGLTKIVLGRSISKIGNSAFYNCSGLNGSILTIPLSLSGIPTGAFAYCAFSKIIVEEGHQRLEVVNGCLIDKARNSILLAENNSSDILYIPESVSLIERFAFSGCDKIKYVKATSNIKLIDDYAFSQCGLYGIELYGGLEQLGAGCFEYCGNLIQVSANSGVPVVRGFRGCSSLKQCDILGENTLQIDSYAFYDCSSLTSLYIPKSVTDIGAYAFAYSGLENLGFDEPDSASYWYRITYSGNKYLMDLSNTTQNAQWFKSDYVDNEWARFNEPQE